MRRYLVFSVVILGPLLASISSSAASVAFPVMISELNTTLVIAGWVLNAYQLIVTIAMPLGGKISETLGEKTSFIIYTVFFSVGSVLCALAPNVYLLIGARVIQAIGGGAILPCAAGIVSDEFPESRQRFIGLFSSIVPIGMIIGPNLGGWMVESFGWRSIFWFNAPLGVVVILLSQLLLRSGSRKSTDTSIDFAGSGLLFGIISAFMFGLTELGSSSNGIPWVFAGTLFALGIILAFAFVRRESRAKEPIVDLTLLIKKPFLAANIYNLVYGTCSLGVISLIPLYAVSIYNMKILQSGIILTSRSLGMMVSSTIVSFFLVRWGYRWPILVGTVAGGIGLVLLALQPHGMVIMGLHIGVTPLLFAVVGFLGIGNGICTPAASNACIELLPEKVATIAGIRGMFRQLGSDIGIAVTTVVLHVLGDMQRAFYLVLLGSALLIRISLPTVFAMPSSPNVSVSRDGQQTRKAAGSPTKS